MNLSLQPTVINLVSLVSFHLGSTKRYFTDVSGAQIMTPLGLGVLQKPYIYIHIHILLFLTSGEFVRIPVRLTTVLHVKKSMNTKGNIIQVVPMKDGPKGLAIISDLASGVIRINKDTYGNSAQTNVITKIGQQISLVI